MNTSSALSQCLDRPDIWVGHRGRKASGVRDTGFASLNALLVDGGWPEGGLIEIGYPRPGSGEWQLLADVLQQCAGHEGYLVLVNPPAMLCAAGLAQLGVLLEKLLIVRATVSADILAAVCEALRIDAVRMLLFWEGRQPFGYGALRKIQLAATDTRVLCYLMRMGASVSAASPAVLRLQLQPQRGGLRLDILRQRGGAEGRQLEIAWPDGWTAQPCESLMAKMPAEAQALSASA